MKKYKSTYSLIPLLLLNLFVFQVFSYGKKKSSNAEKKILSLCLSQKKIKNKQEKTKQIKCFEKLAEKFYRGKKYKKSIAVLNTAKKKNLELPHYHFYLARNYFNLNNWNQASIHSRMYSAKDKITAKENLKILIASSRKKRDWGPCLFSLNKALYKKKFIKKDLFYYENILVCSERMGGDNASLLDLYLEAAKKYPEKNDFIRGTIRLAKLNNKTSLVKKYNNILAKKLYSGSIQKIKFNPKILLGKNNLDKVLIQTSPFNSGASLYRTTILFKKDKKLLSGKNTKNKNFQTYSKDVFCPEDGLVEFVHKAEEEHPAGETKENKMENYIIIMHGLENYSYIFNLQKASIRVKRGQKVKKGEILGKVGNTGREKYPLLEYERRNRGDYKGRSYPLE